VSALPQALNFEPAEIRALGRVDYAACYEAMRRYTVARDETSPDQLWLVEHAPVYTLGQAGKKEHLLVDTGIPLVQIDRGGQITYHGPGQAVVYTLVDLRRRALTVRGFVHLLEQAVIDLLQSFAIVGERRPGAPGVYVNGAKIAALGLRVRNGCCYHGLAFNVDMDLAPFSYINPCGYQGLAVTQLRDLGVDAAPADAAHLLAARINALLAAAAKLALP